MKYIILILLSIFTEKAFSAESLNCLKFWSRFDGTTPFKCQPYQDGFPAQISNSKVSIYHYERNWGDDPIQKQMLKLAGEAAHEAIPMYEKWIKVPDIVFILSDETMHDMSPGEAAWRPSAKPEPCQILLFQGWDTLDAGSSELNEATNRQMIAHEIFHCAQQYDRHDEISGEKFLWGHTSLWWEEGSAEFFSNLVYPTANREFGTGFDFDARKPIFRQNNPYATESYFQYLANAGWSPEDLVAFIRERPTQTSFEAELHAMTPGSAIRNIFHDYAEHYASLDIRDTGGELLQIPILHLEEQAIEVIGDKMSFEWDTVPFAIGVQTLKLKAGQMAKISITHPVNRISVSYRMKGTDYWLPVVLGYPSTFEVPCGEDSFVEVLYTLTTEHQGSKLGLEVEKTSTKQCECKDKSISFDRCLIGNWVLDNNNMVSYLETVLPSYKNISVSGSGFLSWDAEAKTHYDFAEFTILADPKDGGVLKHTRTVMNGSLIGQAHQQGKGQLCVQPEGGVGTITADMPFGPPYVEPLAQGFAGGEVTLNYSCTLQQLMISSSVNGVNTTNLLYRRQ